MASEPTLIELLLECAQGNATSPSAMRDRAARLRQAAARMAEEMAHWTRFPGTPQGDVLIKINGGIDERGVPLVTSGADPGPVKCKPWCGATNYNPGGNFSFIQGKDDYQAFCSPACRDSALREEMRRTCIASADGCCSALKRVNGGGVPSPTPAPTTEEESLAAIAARIGPLPTTGLASAESPPGEPAAMEPGQRCTRNRHDSRDADDHEHFPEIARQWLRDVAEEARHRCKYIEPTPTPEKK